MSAPSEGYCATYFDGRVAAARPATVSIEAGTLAIRTGGDVLHWPLREVRLVARAADSTVRQLRYGEARLTIPDDSAFAWIALACPQLASSLPERRALARQAALWIGGSFAAVAFLIGVIIPFFAASVAVLIPSSVERRLGEMIKQQIFTEFGDRLCTNRVAMPALEGVFAQLQPEGGPIVLMILNGPVVNAFSLPGGQIVVMRGLIDFAKTPDEIVGVLAHELAHHVHRHPLKRFLKAATTSALLGDLTGGTILATAGSFLAATAYSREYEREADATALRWLSAAEYDTGGMGRFFARLEEKEGDETKGPLRYLSTHPPLDERIAATAGGGARSRVQAFSKTQWDAIKAICE
jgi:Zn-dependent protease with chaperone function